MFELQKRGILQQVDVVSSASGGSVSAALYAVSCDDGQACAPPVTPNLNRTVWKESIIYPLLQQNYIDRWRINCWRPENIVRYATYFDRTDVMAETFAETLFGGSRDTEKSFLFRDLNPRRPYLILNSTNNTDSVAVPEIFSFTEQDFSSIRSRLDLFPVAYGVTGSAAFPGAFHYLTLRNYSKPEEKFIHLMDGGVMDNLGIESLWRILLTDDGARYRNVPVLVIVADARPATEAKSEADYDPRHFWDYFVDFSNIKDTYSLLMVENQRLRAREFEKYVKSRGNGLFLDLKFDALKEQHRDLYDKVSSIPTNFKICDEQALNLRKAAEILVGKAVEKIRDRRLLEGPVSTEMTWFLLSLTAALGLATADALTKRYFSDLPPYRMGVVRILVHGPLDGRWRCCSFPRPCRIGPSGSPSAQRSPWRFSPFSSICAPSSSRRFRSPCPFWPSRPSS